MRDDPSVIELQGVNRGACSVQRRAGHAGQRGKRPDRTLSRSALRAPRSALFWLVVLALACVLLVLLPREQGSASPQPTSEKDAWSEASEDDPVPLRRLIVPADQVTRWLHQPEQQVLRLLPRSEFEELLEKARQGKASQGQAPRLLEARYRARLQVAGADEKSGTSWYAEDLVGTAQWRVLHQGQGPGLLSLEPGGKEPASPSMPVGHNFNLALKQPRFANRDAYLARFSGEALALLVDRPGEYDLALGWSARGEVRPEGVRFGLRLPPSPVASLELDLPADRTLTTLGWSLLSGPHPAEKPDRRLWKVVFSGRSQVNLLVRKGPPGHQGDAGVPPHPPGNEGKTGPAPIILAHQKTTQNLTPDGMEATFEFALEMLHLGVQELVCSCDPSLEPLDIHIPQLDSHDLIPGKRPGEPSELVIRLKRPIHEGILTIHCLAPLGLGKPRPASKQPPPPSGQPPGLEWSEHRTIAWKSPAITLRGAITQGETLTLSLHPDLRLESWNPGDFRMQKADRQVSGSFLTGIEGDAGVPPHPPGSEETTSPTTRAEKGPAEGSAGIESTSPPYAHRLILVGGSLASNGQIPRRPEATLETAAVDYRTRELTWWRVTPDGMFLTLQIDYQVYHGRLFRLPILLPDGWEVESVRTQPGDQLGNYFTQRTWAQRKSKPRRKRVVLLLVDLTQPLEARRPGRLSSASLPGTATPEELRLLVELRPSARKQKTPLRGANLLPGPYPFPDALPLGARFREGGLAIEISPTHEAELGEAPANANLENVPEDGPWEDHPPNYYYPYRDSPSNSTLQNLTDPVLQGSLRLRRRAPQLEAHSRTAVHLRGRRATVETQLRIEAISGITNTVHLYLSAGTPTSFRSAEEPNLIRRQERLFSPEASALGSLLAGPHPLHRVMASAWLPRGSLWRLTLNRPLQAGRPVQLAATQHLANQLQRPNTKRSPTTTRERAFRWEVPLPVIVGAHLMDGEVILQRTGVERLDIVGVGLQEDQSPRGPASPSISGEEGGNTNTPSMPEGGRPGGYPHRWSPPVQAWRRFRYGSFPPQGGPFPDNATKPPGPARSYLTGNESVALTLEGENATEASETRGVRIDRAHLHTYLLGQAHSGLSTSRNQALQHRFTFEVANWPSNTLALRLPARARVLAVRVDGSWLARPAILDLATVNIEGNAGQTTGDASLEVELPVPDPSEPLDPSFPDAEPTHHYELIYATESPPWDLWTRVHAPAPVLPSAALSFQRTWYLPEGLSPLFAGLLRQVPGTGPQGRNPTPLRNLVPSLWPQEQPAEAKSPLLVPMRQRSGWEQPFARLDSEARGWRSLVDTLAGPLLVPPSRTPGSPTPREKGPPRSGDLLVSRLEEVLGNKSETTITLPTLVERLTQQFPQRGILVDRLALQEISTLPGTMARDRLALLVTGSPQNNRESRVESPDPERENPSGSGLWTLDSGPDLARPDDILLLTSKDNLKRWQQAGLQGNVDPAHATLPSSLSAPLLRAWQQGRDPTGRFCLALDLLDEYPSPPGLASPRSDEQWAPAGFVSWTAWEPIAGQGATPELWVIRRDLLSACGIVLTVGLICLFWWRRHSPSARIGILLTWLGLAGVGLFWLPPALQDLAWWPLLLGCPLTLGCFLWAAWQNSQPRPLPQNGSSLTRPQANGHSSSDLGSACVAGLLLAVLASPSALGEDSGHPAAPDRPPFPVYLLGGSKAAPEEQRVLAPVPLLEQLRQLAQKPVLAPALVSAHYQGKFVAEAAEFDAEFQIYQPAETPGKLQLPLTRVGLIDTVWLDGRKVSLDTVAGPRQGYELPVAGQGPHRLQLRFRVPVQGRGDERMLRFGAPALAQNELSLVFPPDTLHVQAAPTLGAQRLTRLKPTGDAKGPAGIRLEVDLGPLPTPLQIRWTRGKSTSTPHLEYEEAYLWDLRPEVSSLTAFLRYQVLEGAVPSLKVGLPPGLEVRSCFVVSPSAPAEKPDEHPLARGRPASPRREGDAGVSCGPWAPLAPAGEKVRLREWHVVSGGGSKDNPQAASRWLQLHFHRPVTGIFRVTLTLTPSNPLPTTVDLFPLPWPEGERRGEGYLAYRRHGLHAERIKLLRVTGIRPEEFAPFWEGPSRPDPRTLRYACTLPKSVDRARKPQTLSRSTDHGSRFTISERTPDPTLQLRLRPEHAQPRQAIQELELQVGQRHVQVEAELHLSGEEEEMSFLKVQLEPHDNRGSKDLVVADVLGENVEHWCQLHNQLLVWLKPATRTTIQLRGWQPLHLPRGRLPGTVSLPTIQPQAQEVQTTIRVRSQPGLTLIPENFRQLSPLPASSAPSPLASGKDLQALAQGMTYVARSANYTGTLRVQADVPVHARVWTQLTIQKRHSQGQSPREPQVLFRTILSCRKQAPQPPRTRGGRPASPRSAGDASVPPTPPPPLAASPTLVRVHLHGWQGEEVTLRGARARRIVDRGNTNEHRASIRKWEVELEEGTTTIEIRGQQPVNSLSAGFSVPQLRLPGVARVEHWLALGGNQLVPRTMLGLIPQQAEYPRWASVPAAESPHAPLRVWKSTTGRWQLDLLPVDQPGESPPLRVYLAEASASVTDGQRWLHRVVYWIGHEGSMDLQMTLPREARVVAVSVDDRAVPAFQTQRQLWTSLPAEAGVHRVQVCWHYPRGERLDQPHLDLPTLATSQTGGVTGSAPPAAPRGLDSPTLWTVEIPLGWVLKRTREEKNAQRLGSGLTRLADLSLHRASAQLEISRHLAARLRRSEIHEQLTQAQERFAHYCRQAELALKQLDQDTANGSERLDSLRQENNQLAQQRDFSDLLKKVEAEKRGAATRRPAFFRQEQGTPISWYGRSGLAAPHPELEGEEMAQTRQAIGASALWLGLLLGIGLISTSVHLRPRVLSLWPELLLLLGVLGWLLTGPALTILVLLTLGALGRTFSLFRRAQGWLAGTPASALAGSERQG
jgi:hypothetical protein